MEKYCKCAYSRSNISGRSTSTRGTNGSMGARSSILTRRSVGSSRSLKQEIIHDMMLQGVTNITFFLHTTAANVDQMSFII